MADVYSLSTTTDFNNQLVRFVRNRLISNLRAGLPHGPAGAIDPNTYQVGHTDEYVYPGVADLPVVLNDLAEITPPAVEPIQSYLQTFTTRELARSVGFSSKLLRQQSFPVAQTVAERVARDASVALDEIMRLEWAAAHTGEKSLGVGTTDLTSDLLVDAVTWMRAHDIPPLPSGYYGLIVPAETLGVIQKETGEKSWNSAQLEDPTALTTGAVGRWKGIEFFTSSRAAPASGTVATGILVGSQSIAVADPTSLQTFSVLPSASIADPAAQRGIITWRARYGAMAIGRKKTIGDAGLVYSHVKIVHKFTAS